MPKFALLSLLGVLLLAGCTGEEPKSPAAEPKTASKPLKVGVVFDSGGRGDKSFNDSAWAGVERAQKEFGIEPKTIESKAEKDYEDNIRGLAEQGCDIVFAVGLAQDKGLKAVAPEFPNVKFGIIDGNVEGPNVRSMQFAEHEGSFLAGYAAGLATRSGKVGFVGGMSIPLIKKFEAGYVAGVKAANPKAEVLPAKYTESWVDVNLGKAAANVLFQQGADVVYHASGRCGLGVIEAAKDNKKLAIGVDSDQDDVAPGFVLTSMIKRVDEAVYRTIADVAAGKFTPGVVAYDLKSSGVGLSKFAHTVDRLGADGLARIEAAKKKIEDGTWVVPQDQAALQDFLTNFTP
jgi:basic membrane protein A